MENVVKYCCARLEFTILFVQLQNSKSDMDNHRQNIDEHNKGFYDHKKNKDKLQAERK